MEETPLGHVCTVNTQPGSLLHTGGIPVAEQWVRRQAVPAILTTPPFSPFKMCWFPLCPTTENEIFPELPDYLADTKGADD